MLQSFVLDDLDHFCLRSILSWTHRHRRHPSKREFLTKSRLQVFDFAADKDLDLFQVAVDLRVLKGLRGHASYWWNPRNLMHGFIHHQKKAPPNNQPQVPKWENIREQGKRCDEEEKLSRYQLCLVEVELANLSIEASLESEILREEVSDELCILLIRLIIDRLPLFLVLDEVAVDVLL